MGLVVLHRPDPAEHLHQGCVAHLHRGLEGPHRQGLEGHHPQDPVGPLRLDPVDAVGPHPDEGAVEVLSAEGVLPRLKTGAGNAAPPRSDVNLKGGDPRREGVLLLSAEGRGLLAKGTRGVHGGTRGVPEETIIETDLRGESIERDRLEERREVQGGRDLDLLGGREGIDGLEWLMYQFRCQLSNS